MKNLACPVCGKSLTQDEYDKALGLWQEKHEHIKHLEAERKKLQQQERELKKEQARLRKEAAGERKKLRQEAKEQARVFTRQRSAWKRDTQQLIADQARKSDARLKEQRAQIERVFTRKMTVEIKRGVEKGVEQQRKDFKKQQGELSKTRNKMVQLENSLNVSARKYQQASEEIKKLKEQIEKGVTPQIEGLLEEKTLLAKLQELFPQDKFDHPGKGGDIIQVVMMQGKPVGSVVYECKKVKHFDKKFIEQAREARRLRGADFAVLLTNVFPSKKQYYFVDKQKSVFVISPVSLEPIAYTLRESLLKIALLKISNEAKEKAVQKVYDYLSSNEYNNKMNDVAGQLVELATDLKAEMNSHKRTWQKRYDIYTGLFYDVGAIDFKLRGLIQHRLEQRSKVTLEAKPFILIEGLDQKRKLLGEGKPSQS